MPDEDEDWGESDSAVPVHVAERVERKEFVDGEPYSYSVEAEASLVLVSVRAGA